MVLATQLPIAISKAYSPGHVTGFFASRSDNNNIPTVYQGSIGAGFSIEKGIYSTVKIYPSSTKSFDIKLNGITCLDLKVSRFIVEHYLKQTDYPVFISVEHETEIPIGYGLGSSGAAALSLSYAINDALGINYNKIKAAQVAHYADIACKTGLGTVVSEYTGGFEIRTGYGGPGIGKVVKKSVTSDWIAIILCLAPINTNCFLNISAEDEKKCYLNYLGKKMTDDLVKNPNISNFLSMSYTFVSEYGFESDLCRKPLEVLRSNGYRPSIALFGQTVFTLIKEYDLHALVSLLRPYLGKLIISRIDNHGARLVKEKTNEK